MDPSNPAKSNKRPPERPKPDPKSHSSSSAVSAADTHPSSAKKPRPNHYHTPHHHKPGHDRRSKPDTSSSSNRVVKASHVLIKHQGSRRKASWRDPDGVRISATTREAAVERLQQIRDEIESGKTRFEEAATQHSDCSSYKRGGDLGPFGRGKMQKPFEEAAFALKVGEMSDIIDTDSGVHIILRTA
ncbi:Peptidyl-prolyl cis-trans isomerase [Rhynchospora pubera]|uniref:Peptidyl-prolyl cis-trans isomerase n=1 Tax=Rhynchospora pubera TaxID=906938 RepID=A0AAV8EBZ6_9POAL|nr:Peptidyl-prolyl cis-trans isomerase [Rhynchospora pubera]